MYEKFQMILDANEEVKWCGDINVGAYVRKHFIKTFLFGLFPPFAILMLGAPYGWLLLTLSLLEIIPLWIGVAHFSFSVLAALVYLIVLYKQAKNTFLCVTDKRVIKRSGAFTNDFIHYSLKNVGNVRVDGSVFDGNGDNPSASLLVTVKNYHTDTSGKAAPQVLKIDSVKGAYDAYKLISALTEGNNENFRVKMEE